MTGFARRERRDTVGELVWEVRSVNHRYLETSLRLPEEFRAMEPAIREQLARRLGRGKVDCGLRYRPQEAAVAGLKLNERLFEQLLGASIDLAARMPGARAPAVIDFLRWPGLIETPETDFTPVQAAASELLEQALDDLVEARAGEGARITELIRQRCGAMREQVARARARMPLVVQGLRERFLARLQEVALEPDLGRLEQELALWVQRLDVDEEMDRLTSHLDEVEACLARDEPVGRRLDFLMQELNREANTLGSKSADAETTAVSVEMKVLIEQMREQIQNIE